MRTFLIKTRSRLRNNTSISRDKPFSAGTFGFSGSDVGVLMKVVKKVCVDVCEAVGEAEGDAV